MQITFDPSAPADVEFMRRMLGASVAVVPAPPPPTPPPTQPAGPPPAAPVALPRAIRSLPINGGQLGSLSWAAGGASYHLLVVNSGIASWADLYRSPAVPANNVWSIPVSLDGALDLHSDEIADDTAIRAWIARRILPKLNAWLQANPSATQGMVLGPVSTADVPVDWPTDDRAAARLAQWVVVSESPPAAALRT